MVVPIKGRLVVEGNVQGVGYRVIVRQIARKNGIKGKVKNIDNGNVEIYCEGDNQTSVLKFVESIEIKSKHDDISTINVETIQKFWEGEEGYNLLDEPMERFEIDYEGDIEQKNLERLETGSLMMYGVNEKLSTTHSDFNKLDDKYDKVSQKLDAINNNISNLVDHLGTIIDRFVEDRAENEQQN